MGAATATKIIHLMYPILDGQGKEIKSLEMRRAKAKDLQEMQKQSSPWEQEAYLLARLTGLVPEDIAELDIADYKTLQNELEAQTRGK